MKSNEAEAIFTAHSTGESLKFEFPEQVQMYLRQRPGVKISVGLIEEDFLPERHKINRFFHGVVLHYGMMAYDRAGYTGCDKFFVKYQLQLLFAKDYQKKGDEYEVFVRPTSQMNKSRFYRFVRDSVMHIEEMGVNIPDAERYLEMIQTI